MNYQNTMRPTKKVWLNFYFISILFFTVWMFFFDYQNIFVQYSLYKRWNKLQTDAIDYTFQIQKIKKDKKELASNPDFLEQLAREKYYMKREKEDLYVIIPA
ncbi:Septum formation initiator subfamily, putative [Cardinium endosymbiont cEper1 of Encarsia pergandiella]|uniref:septum formation initiator family protein n=1 Tax=Cardinium endosymbiont of Encarsia pergandiella TaxID=249402 RepID=UPI00027EA9DA|nr:septum formation initiator family protein [Cardinium endosymbiont of Encarsia pergandiella]CCM09848.1 Septum formation initiator subfamily, putative [Cardinium endosymbiont cEper1 of Encarsia pergandiella]